MKLVAEMAESRLLRFVVVGVVNTAVGFMIYALMLWVGLNYAAAAAVATVLGMLFNFKSTGWLVFGSSENRLLLRFVAVYGVLYLVNVFALTALTSMGLSAYSAGLVTLLPAALLSYVLNKTLVFRAVS